MIPWKWSFSRNSCVVKTSEGASLKNYSYAYLCSLNILGATGICISELGYGFSSINKILIEINKIIFI